MNRKINGTFVMQFQFHKGTIKTFMLNMNNRSNINFNSIKVRLKRYFPEVYANMKVFQFHKGTIKTVGLSLGAAAILGFQFHKGTIKTKIDLSSTSIYDYFNSIKVRLKHIVLTPDGRCFSNFNSIKVRLKLSFTSLFFTYFSISIP